MKRLAIVTTHPIQYYAPLFSALAEHIALRVFYTWGEGSISKIDPGFGKVIEWDIPLLQGYEYIFLDNASKNPGSHHFYGIQNPNVVREIDSFDPDAVLVFGWSYHSHLQVIRHFSGKRQVWFRGDSTLLDENSNLKRFIRTTFLKWIYSHVDRAFYVGTNNREYFAACGFKPEQLTFSPHAVDNDRFQKVDSRDVTEFRESLGIKPDDTVILFAGKFEDKKDPILLLDSFKSLSEPTRHLLFVGNGSLEAKLKGAGQLFPNVHFLDFYNQSKLPLVYHSCDLFCLPSRGPGETWGLAINEAMACGKAVLASDKVGCARDLIIPGRNGEIFTAGNKEDLTKKLNTLFDGIKLKEYGEESHKLIQSWNFREICKNIINSYESKGQN